MGELHDKIKDRMGQEEFARRQKDLKKIEDSEEYRRIHNLWMALILYLTEYTSTEPTEVNSLRMFAWGQKNGVDIEALNAHVSSTLAKMIMQDKDPPAAALQFVDSGLSKKVGYLLLSFFALGYETHDKKTTFVDYLIGEHGEHVEQDD